MLNNYKVLNDKKIINFLKMGINQSNNQRKSFFKNIFKIEAGVNYIVKEDLSIKKDFYWRQK